MQDEIIKAISDDGFVSVSVISSTEMVKRAMDIHSSTAVVTAALGRVISATSIIGTMLKKSGASVTVRVNGGGPVGSIIAVSDDEGFARIYAQNPKADIANLSKTKLNVGGIVGTKGMLSVIKDYGEKEPYTGAAELVSGEIAEDFAAYFAKSEQIPTACAFGVLIDKGTEVLTSGGYIAQTLPGASDMHIDKLEKNVADTGAVTGILSGFGHIKLLELIMSGFSPRIIERRPVSYRCSCSRERVLSAVYSLGKSEIEDMITKGEDIETTCQFCDAVYVFKPHMLKIKT